MVKVMRQYYVLTQDPALEPIFEFIRHHDLTLEVHLNRTRFWVPDGTVLTEFLLRFSTVATLVDESLDLITGLPLQ
jgi:hypothetical protein